MDKLNPCQQCGGDIPNTTHRPVHTQHYQRKQFCSRGCASKHAGLNRGPEWRKKNSEAKMGEKNPRYGKPNSNPNWSKNLVRGYWKGKKQTPESNQKRSEAMMGVSKSPESIAKMKATKAKNSHPPEFKQEFKEYMRAVRYWSNKQDLSSLDNIEKRGINWHLDHKYTILDGFNAGVPVDMMSHINNLQILPRKLNTAKGTKSCITLKELVCIARK